MLLSLKETESRKEYYLFVNIQSELTFLCQNINCCTKEWLADSKAGAAVQTCHLNKLYELWELCSQHSTKESEKLLLLTIACQAAHRG